MNRTSIFAIFAACTMTCCSCSPGNEQTAAPKPDGFKEITFDAPDHHKVYADFYPSLTLNSEKVILMFHQAGSNAGEYETIEPIMANMGFNCIAVDQRSGGDMWGRSNRTAAQSGKGDYFGAYNDLKGALEYAESKSYTTIVVWGSSYSASLVLMLADEFPELKGVIAFSPGEYFDDKGIAKTWASRVSEPILFACTPDELKDGRQQLYDVIPSDSKNLVVFPGGVHGSSTLLQEKSSAASKYLEKVQTFLTGLKSG